ncbi:phosphoribosylanthranilate isomerase [Desulfobotulus alkaliphilus]|uniref:N-(5'-phosphoribosyl)anthranilate isomerase n=1 Tax=Desulfobotulus alkaliphilus TaxID=622671 RepID=A0A562RQG7_9BACT|nr:phosphoribosylanthranilate isomerase [Desulfobotulus alkaliphilus]TWI71153.1 phosphoribosylanthranilate isomerase [Desulfobotulus alkaliphilus]
MTFIKICGITHPDTARFCSALRVDAIGCVFFPKSPRHLDVKTARQITDAVSPDILTVAVMVNPDAETAIRTAKEAGCRGIQLHGRESPELAARIMEEGFFLIKGLYLHQEPSTASAPRYSADRFLVEAAAGTMPGGNAKSWDWAAAKDFCQKYPALLAGGLNPDNVKEALIKAKPFGVDVSSGVESSPGIKDHEKIKSFVEAVRTSPV